MFNIYLEKKLNNFSNISDEECASVIQNNLLESLESETYFEWQLISKFLSIGYEIRENLCKLFEGAIKRNQQIVGGAPINYWLRGYDDKTPFAKRGPSTFSEYVSQNPATKNLGKKDQLTLMRIFRIYDYLFVVPIFDLEDAPAASIMRNNLSSEQMPEDLQRESEYVTSSIRPPRDLKMSKKINLREALRAYPKLGEQNISSYPLKIKSFDRPVRPSIRNWLYDYTSHLGQAGHSSIDRTNYLFRSENTARLGSQEREKLGIILKSFDENTPLPIDAETQEVVFDVSKVRPFPSGEQVAGIPQGQTLSEQTPRDMFTRPYPRNELKPPIQDKAQKTQYNIPDTRYPVSPAGSQIPNTKKKFEESGGITYINPYPKPGSHEIYPEKQGEIPATDSSPLKVKGFSEGTPSVSSQPNLAKSPARKPAFRPEPPKPYVPSHPKNIIYPHYLQGEERSEPKINGNTVDLREDQQ